MRYLPLILVLAAAPAVAQETSTPAQRALQQRVMFEIQTNIQCSAELIAAQQRIKELEVKLAEKEKAKGEDNVSD